MEQREEMTVRAERIGDAVVLSPVGDVDLSRSPVLRQSLRAAQGDRPGRLVVDLANVEYMDSSGVATLVEALQHARKTSTPMILCNMKARVRSIFEIARLDTVFTIRATREDALAD